MSETSPRSHWPKEIQDAFTADEFNPCVGTTLLSETDRVRVWHLHIPAGGRCGFHRHVLNYFWTALNEGRARNYFEDGRIGETPHYKGQTRHLDFGAGEHMVHCVENIGTTDLNFTTVEFLDSPNQALPVPDGVRLKVAA